MPAKIVLQHCRKETPTPDRGVDGFGELLPSGLISDSGDEAFFRDARNRSASNQSGNLVVPGSDSDPFAAPLTTLI